MTYENRLKMVTEIKDLGNNSVKEKKYSDAIEIYNNALSNL
jgi:hypothetical protein